MDNFATYPLLYPVHPDQCSSCSKDCNNGYCIIVNGDEHCKCDDGYANLNNDPFNTCKTIDCDTLPCGSGECINSNGTFTCICPDNYLQGNGNRQCQQCEAGFELVTELGTCQDIDECEFYPCGFGTCSNSEGSFNCICPDGFLAEDGYKQCRTCESGFEPGIELGTCQDIDECELDSCGYGSCSNSIGSFNCTCPDGFLAGEGNQQCRTCESGFEPGIELEACQDIDECELDSCGYGSCSNSIGSFNCICPDGFLQGEGNEQCKTCEREGFEPRNQFEPCQDIDECEYFDCGKGICQNNIENHSCICNEGFVNAFYDQRAICGKYNL